MDFQRHPRRYSWIGGILATVGLVFLPSAHAATLNWTNTAGGLWQTAGNWNPNSTALSTNSVTITNAGTYTVVVDDSTANNNPAGAGSWMLLPSAQIAGSAGGINLLVNFTNASQALVFSNNASSTALTLASTPGNATLTLSNGTVEARIAEFHIGNVAGANGTVAMTGGTLLITNGNSTFLGYAGGSTGTLDVAGGTVVAANPRIGGVATSTNATGFWIARGNSTNIVYDPYFGYGTNSYGRLEVKDSALFLIQDQLFLGNSWGSTGVVVVSGGSFLATNQANDRIKIGSGVGGYGSFVLSNGVVDLLTTSVDVGYNGGRGNLTLVNGQMTVTNGTLVAGAAVGVTGNVTVVGGTLTTKSLYLGTGGAGAVGTMAVHGGSVTNLNTLTIGGTGSGSLVVDGGSMVASNQVLLGGNSVLGYGSLTVTGGTFTTPAGNFYVGTGSAGSTGSLFVAGSGAMSVNAANLSIGANVGNTGLVTVAGGSLFLGGTANFSLGAGAGGAGALNVYGGSVTITNGQVRVGAASGGYGILNVTGGTATVTGSLYANQAAGSTGRVVVSGGALNVTNAAGSALLHVSFASGLGTFAQSNGTVVANTTIVGQNGQMTLAGGTYSNTSYFYVNGGIGAGGTTSSVTVSDGSLTALGGANGVQIGSAVGPSLFSVSGGQVTLSNLYVAKIAGASASWLISGGTNTVLGSAFNLANGAGYTGQVVLAQNGMLVANGATLQVGAATYSPTSVGSLILSNSSTLQVGGLQLTGTNALFEVDGGSATLASASLVLQNGGRLVQNGGTLVLSNAFNNYAGSAVISNGITRVLGYDSVNKFGVSVGGGSSGGNGSLGIYGGLLSVVSNFFVGFNNSSTGSVTLANGGVLELAGSLSVGGATTSKIGAFTNQNGGVLRFLTNAPTVAVGANGSMVTTNAVVEFMGASAFQTNVFASLGLQANNTVSLNASTNAALPSYTFGGGLAFSGLRLLGNSLWQSTNLLIGTGGSLLVSNANATIASPLASGVLTNRGNITVWDSTVGYSQQVDVVGSYVSQDSTNNFARGLVVESGAIYRLLGASAASGALTNSGLLSVGSGSAYTLTSGSPGGTLNVDAGGRLNLSGGAYSLGGSTMTNNGTMEVLGGASLSFAGGAATPVGGGAVWVDGGASLSFSNGAYVMNNAVTSSGQVNVVNSSVTYTAPVTIGGVYSSDPSTNTFTTNVIVTASGALQGASGDLFVFQKDFLMFSTNAQFSLSGAAVLFTNGPQHLLSISNSGALNIGQGYTNFSQVASNFAIGAMSIASGDRVTLAGNKDSLTNALYVGWLDIQGSFDTNSYTAVTNAIFLALSLPNINLYYDKYDPRNGWLNANLLNDSAFGYNLWSGGLLLPIPEPSSLLALVAGFGLFAAFRARSGKA